MEAKITKTIQAAVAASTMKPVEIARRADVSPAQLSRFLRNERSLTLPAVERLCEVLGLELKPVAVKAKRKGKR